VVLETTEEGVEAEDDVGVEDEEDSDVGDC
jgi:hypothetical protein